MMTVMMIMTKTKMTQNSHSLLCIFKSEEKEVALQYVSSSIRILILKIYRLLIRVISDGLVHQLHHSLAEGAGQVIVDLQDWVLSRTSFSKLPPAKKKMSHFQMDCFNPFSTLSGHLTTSF